MEYTIFHDEIRAVGTSGYSRSITVTTNLDDLVEVQGLNSVPNDGTLSPADARRVAAMLDAAAAFLEGES